MDEDKPGDARNIGPDLRDSALDVRGRIPVRISTNDPVDGYIMTAGYAIGVIVLSMGAVILTITLAVLCFLYPDKANSFLVLLASPLAVLVIANSVKIGGVIREQIAVRQEQKEVRKVIEEKIDNVDSR